VDGVRVLPDRRPRLGLWIVGRPKSQRTRAPVRYAVLDVDNALKRILDPLKGIVYDSDAQIRVVKSVGLRLDQGFRARGSPEVFKRLLSGKEFLVNIYEGERETDVYLVDVSTPETGKPSLVMLSIAQPAVTESPAT
jgi:hypothetical protein